MELSALKQQICKNTLDHFYIFTGEERGIMRLYINEIAKIKNAKIQSVDSVVNVLPKLRTKNMLGEYSIFLVYDDKQFILDDKLKERLVSPDAFGDVLVIFIYTTLDKRSKIYKNYQDYIVSFDLLRSDVLAKYVRAEIGLTDANCKRLIEVCEGSYSRSMLEIDKIIQYQSATGIISPNVAFENLLDSGTIYIPPYDAVFDFVDAVLTKKILKAFNLLQQSYDSGEATLVLLSNLYTSAKQTLQVQSYQGDNLASATGLTPFQIKMANCRKNVYTDNELIRLMRLVQSTEIGIKTGTIDDAIAVQSLLVELWS